MSYEVLVKLGQILGVGGLSLGILLIIFRDVIRKNLFPKLNQIHSYKLLRLIITLTFVIAVLGLGLWGYIQSHQSQETRALSAKPKIAQFALNMSKSSFYETKEGKFAIGDPIRTFSIDPSFFGVISSFRAIFSVSIENASDVELLVTDVQYEVSDIGQVMGGGAGPLESNQTYFHKLKYEKGIQKHILVPPYKIPPRSIGAFELEIYTDNKEPGLAWIMKTTFVTNLGSVSTDEFQLILTGKDTSQDTEIISKSVIDQLNAPKEKDEYQIIILEEEKSNL